MNTSKIAVRYSKALFMSALEKKKIMEVRHDMLYLLRLSAMDDFRDLIESPVISNSKRKEIMEALFREQLSEISYSLIQLCIENNREAFLPGIARSYIDRADEHEGITKVMLKTAVELSKDNRERFVEIVERDMNTKADIEEVIDSNIGGGYILKVEDMYVDASLKTQLRRIKQELLNE